MAGTASFTDEPRQKKLVNKQFVSPFPVPIETYTKKPVEADDWPVYVGNLSGSRVLVSDTEDIRRIYWNGFFGKGTMSRSDPKFEAARAEDEEFDEDAASVFEHLQLSLEEAFFLSYGLGCLAVLDEEEKPIDLSQMWSLYRNRQPSFLSTYIAYHYYRSKGWVVRSGLKYGTNFILYKLGPPYYHASFAVLVQMVDEDSLEPCGEGAPKHTAANSWPGMSALSRINDHVAKEFLLCYVVKPSDLSQEEVVSPNCIARFTVKETVIKRWVPARERDSCSKKTA